MTATPRTATLLLLAGALPSCVGVRMASGPALGPELFPLTARSQEYVTKRGVRCRQRVEPSGEDAATLWLEGGSTPLHKEITRTQQGLAFSGSLGSSVELMRFGAAAGATWRSGPTVVRFMGWERIEVPAGLFDAARIETSIPDQGLRQDETWWFARGVGIVRQSIDRGGIDSDEMTLVSRPLASSPEH